MVDVVLHQPEIPQNTGSIGRTCVAVGSALHLIHPLGFSIDEKACRRAGLDYWPRLRLREHEAWGAYVDATPGVRRWFLTTRARRCLWDVAFEPGDHLVFGGESRGLPGEILAADPDATIGLPMRPGERSLNVSTAVCAALYEAVRQMVGRGIAGVGEGLRLEERRADARNLPDAPPDA